MMTRTSRLMTGCIALGADEIPELVRELMAVRTIGLRLVVTSQFRTLTFLHLVSFESLWCKPASCYLTSLKLISFSILA